MKPANEPIPPNADVAIVGSGYCGLTLARADRSVVVLDAEDPSFGSSSRNHGHTGTNGSKTPFDLVKRVGEEQAKRVWKDSAALARFLTDFLGQKQLDVDFVQ